MLIELNATPLISGRHSGGGSETAMLLLPPGGSPAGPAGHQFHQNVPEEEREQNEHGTEQEPGGIVPSSLEHQIQARLLVVDKRLHQAMYNSS